MSGYSNNPYLDTYLQMANMQEVSEFANLWCGLFTLSAALERRCTTQWCDLVWPNEWMCLVGHPGDRKTVAMRESLRVMEQCNLWIGPRVTSIEMLMSEFSDYSNFQVYQLPKSEVLEFHGSIVIYVEELTAFTKVRDSEYVQKLCDLYDCPHKYPVQTLKRGKEMARNICLNLLAGTTPDALRKHMPDEMLSGGFGSRVMFIWVDKPTELKNTPTDKVKQAALARKCADWLDEVLLLKGDFTVTERAFELYEKWRDVSHHVDPPPIYYVPSFQHYLGRRETHFRKLLMSCSVGRSHDLIITEEDFNLALKILLKTEDLMPRALGAVQPQSDSEMFTYLGINIGLASPALRRPDAKGLKKEDLMKLAAGHWSKEQLDEALSMMLKCKYIRRLKVDEKDRYIKGSDFPQDWEY